MHKDGQDRSPLHKKSLSEGESRLQKSLERDSHSPKRRDSRERRSKSPDKRRHRSRSRDRGDSRSPERRRRRDHRRSPIRDSRGRMFSRNLVFLTLLIVVSFSSQSREWSLYLRSKLWGRSWSWIFWTPNAVFCFCFFFHCANIRCQ